VAHCWVEGILIRHKSVARLVLSWSCSGTLPLQRLMQPMSSGYLETRLGLIPTFEPTLFLYGQRSAFAEPGIGGAPMKRCYSTHLLSCVHKRRRIMQGDLCLSADWQTVNALASRLFLQTGKEISEQGPARAASSK